MGLVTLEEERCDVVLLHVRVPSINEEERPFTRSQPGCTVTLAFQALS